VEVCENVASADADKTITGFYDSHVAYLNDATKKAALAAAFGTANTDALKAANMSVTYEYKKGTASGNYADLVATTTTTAAATVTEAAAAETKAAAAKKVVVVTVSVSMKVDAEDAAAAAALLNNSTALKSAWATAFAKKVEGLEASQVTVVFSVAAKKGRALAAQDFDLVATYTTTDVSADVASAATTAVAAADFKTSLKAGIDTEVAKDTSLAGFALNSVKSAAATATAVTTAAATATTAAAASTAAATEAATTAAAATTKAAADDETSAGYEMSAVTALALAAFANLLC